MRLALGAFVSTACAAGLLISSAIFSACGSEATSSPTADAALEATATLDDTSTPDTYVPDANAPDTTPVQTYCGVLSDLPHQVRFCDDFDDHDATNNWSASAIAGTPDSVVPVLAEDPNTSVSAPLSLTAAVKALKAGEGAVALLRATIIATVAHPVFQFQGRFNQTLFTDGTVVIARLNVTLSDHFFNLYLYDPLATPPGPSLEETVNGNMVIHHPLTISPAVDTWQNIVMDIDLAAGIANVTFGGTPALVNETITKGVGTEATIRIGIISAMGVLPDFIANFDNVVLDF